MTILQPNKSKFSANMTILVLALVFIFGSLYLITLYNRLVSINHNISKLNSKFNNTQILISESREKLLGIMDSENLEKIAKERNLIKDRNPIYMEINPAMLAATANGQI